MHFFQGMIKPIPPQRTTHKTKEKRLRYTHVVHLGVPKKSRIKKLPSIHAHVNTFCVNTMYNRGR